MSTIVAPMRRLRQRLRSTRGRPKSTLGSVPDMKAGALLTAAACALALPMTAAAGTLPLVQSPAAGTYTDAEPANTVGFSFASLAAGAGAARPGNPVPV